MCVSASHSAHSKLEHGNTACRLTTWQTQLHSNSDPLKFRYTQTQIHILCVCASLSRLTKHDIILFLSVCTHRHRHTPIQTHTCTLTDMNAHSHTITHRHTHTGRNAPHSECFIRVHSANVTSVRLTFSPLLMSSVFMNTELISLDA